MNRVEVPDDKPVVAVNWAHIVDLAKVFAKTARAAKEKGSDTILAHLVAITQRACEAQGTVVPAQVEPLVRDIVEQFLTGLRANKVPFHFVTEVAHDPDPKRGVNKAVQGAPVGNGAAGRKPAGTRRHKDRVRL